MYHTVSLVHSTTNGDDLLAYMARVSNPTAKPGDPAERLIKYLIKHKHWSPFEMVNMCVEIETTRSLAAQILRHKSFSFQEFSQRYAKVTEPAVIPHLRRQDTKNRQNSIDDLPEATVNYFTEKIKNYFELGRALYEEMLEADIAKECAREVLPLATPTKLYMYGTLRSWIHYIDLRTANGTQHEHKLVAQGAKQVFQQQFPLAFDAVWPS